MTPVYRCVGTHELDCRTLQHHSLKVQIIHSAIFSRNWHYEKMVGIFCCLHAVVTKIMGLLIFGVDEKSSKAEPHFIPFLRQISP